MVQDKERLYTTAFSTLFGIYVSINEAYQDSDGRWIYTCSSACPGNVLDRVLFTETELERFCI